MERPFLSARVYRECSPGPRPSPPRLEGTNPPRTPPGAQDSDLPFKQQWTFNTKTIKYDTVRSESLHREDGRSLLSTEPTSTDSSGPSKSEGVNSYK